MIKVRLGDGSIVTPVAYVAECKDKTADFPLYTQAERYIKENAHEELKAFMDSNFDFRDSHIETFISNYTKLSVFDKTAFITLLRTAVSISE